LSLIENSLEKLRRAAAGGKATGAAARREPVAVLREPAAAAPESRYLHRRTSLDLAQLRAAGYLPHPAQERRFADWCHRVKRPIIHRALLPGGPEDARSILLTSALPGDGKTFVTLNLALSIARERDVSVLLIDGDLPRARLSDLLGIQREPGLLHALQDERLDIEQLVHDTDIPGLQILSAGGPAEGTTELIASARMREIVAQLMGWNPRRLILFDSPPLLISAEARALVAIPGQIVLVTRAGHTPQRAVVDAVAQIDKKKLHGLIINDGYVGKVHGYYDYNYDYSSERAPSR
jgi:Mrp family chromosome partitioning ATPase